MQGKKSQNVLRVNQQTIRAWKREKVLTKSVLQEISDNL